MSNANIPIPVDLTSPGQFFACCGLLELADRLVEPQRKRHPGRSEAGSYRRALRYESRR